LQDSDFIKIGSPIPQKVDVWFIAVTNPDLEPLMTKNKFRKDLCYHLKGGYLSECPILTVAPWK
jgi:transcriptional regulator with GAF, ATPase, and Fis domain